MLIFSYLSCSGWGFGVEGDQGTESSIHGFRSPASMRFNLQILGQFFHLFLLLQRRNMLCAWCLTYNCGVRRSWMNSIGNCSALYKYSDWMNSSDIIDTHTSGRTSYTAFPHCSHRHLLLILNRHFLLVFFFFVCFSLLWWHVDFKCLLPLLIYIYFLFVCSLLMVCLRFKNPKYLFHPAFFFLPVGSYFLQDYVFFFSSVGVYVCKCVEIYPLELSLLCFTSWFLS